MGKFNNFVYLRYESTICHMGNSWSIEITPMSRNGGTMGSLQRISARKDQIIEVKMAVGPWTIYFERGSKSTPGCKIKYWWVF